MDYNPFKKPISELSNLKPSKGRLLISEPFMSDPNFQRSVILITEYNNEGIMGFILNHPLPFKIEDVLEDFPKFAALLYEGGPVSGDQLFFIHNQGNKIEDSIEITDDVYWSGDISQLKGMIHNKEISPSDVKFFLGYSGWDKAQLDRELKSNSWFVQEANPSIVFDNDLDLWKKVVENSSKEISIMAKFPLDPKLN